MGVDAPLSTAIAFGTTSPTPKDEQRPWSRSTVASPRDRWGLYSIPSSPSPAPYSDSASPLPLYAVGDSYRIPTDGRKMALSSGCTLPQKSGRKRMESGPFDKLRAADGIGRGASSPSGFCRRPWREGRSLEDQEALRPRPGTSLGTFQYATRSETPASPLPARPATSLGLTSSPEYHSTTSDQGSTSRPHTSLGMSAPSRAGADSADSPARPATALGVTATTTLTLLTDGQQTLSSRASPSSTSPPGSRASSPPPWAQRTMCRAPPEANPTPEAPRELLNSSHPWLGAEWLQSPPPWEEERRPAPPPGTCLAEVTNRIMRPYAVWCDKLWLQARTEVLNEDVLLQGGQAEGISRLFALARHSTEEAIDRGQYKVQWEYARPRTIDLAHIMEGYPKSQWYGMQNTQMPEEMQVVGHHAATIHNGQVVPPPLLISDASPLDVAVNLHMKAGPKQPVVLVVELMDFNNDGGVDLRSSTCAAPSDLFLRTDFKRYLEAAQSELRNSAVTRLRDHLKDKDDPFILHCPNVTVFRGPHENGYPYLEEPMKLHIIAYALHNCKPLVQSVMRRKYGPTEWYVDQSDHGTLLERLNLIGMVALERCLEVSPAPPMMIMVAPGCCGPARQPRDALANSMKHWRRVFGHYFHSVFVCCRGRGGPDEVMSMYLNSIVNKQVHRMCGNETLMSHFHGWDFELDELEKAVNVKEMKQAERHVKKSLAHVLKNPGINVVADADGEDDAEPDTELTFGASGTLQTPMSRPASRKSGQILPKQMQQSMHRATVVAGLSVGAEMEASSSDEDDNPPPTIPLAHSMMGLPKSAKVALSVYDAEIGMAEITMGDTLVYGRDSPTSPRMSNRPSSPGPGSPAFSRQVSPKASLNVGASRGGSFAAGINLHNKEQFNMNLSKLHGKFLMPRASTESEAKHPKKKKKKRRSKMDDGSRRGSGRSEASYRDSYLSDQGIIEQDEKPEQQTGQSGNEPAKEQRIARSASLDFTERPFGLCLTMPSSMPTSPRRWSTSNVSSRPMSAAKSEMLGGSRRSSLTADFVPKVGARIRRRSCQIEARGALRSYDWEPAQSKVEFLKQLQMRELFNVSRPRSASISGHSKSSKDPISPRYLTEDELESHMEETTLKDNDFADQEKRRASRSIADMVGQCANVMTSREAVHKVGGKASLGPENPDAGRIEIRGVKKQVVSAKGLQMREEFRRRLSQKRNSGAHNSADTQASGSPTPISQPGSSGQNAGRPRRLSQGLIRSNPAATAASAESRSSGQDVDGAEHIVEDDEVKLNNAASMDISYGSAATAPARPAQPSKVPLPPRATSLRAENSEDASPRQLLRPAVPSSPRRSACKSPKARKVEEGKKILNMAMRHVPLSSATQDASGRTPKAKKNSDDFQDLIQNLAGNVEGRLESRRMNSDSRPGSTRPSVAPP